MKLPAGYYCKAHPGVEPYVKNCGLIRPKCSNRPVMRKLQYKCWRCGRITKTLVRPHRVYPIGPRQYFGFTLVEWAVLLFGIACGLVAFSGLFGCAYQSETRDKRVRVAVFSNNQRSAYGETEIVSGESAKVAALAAAAYIKSALAAAAIALPEVSKTAVEAVKLSGDSTTQTLEESHR